MVPEIMSLNLIDFFSAHCANWCAASSSQWAMCLLSLPWLPPFSFHGVVKCPDGSEHCQAHTHQDLRRKGTMGVWGFPYPWPLEAKVTLERWWW